ncbi:hypothetical protein CRE_06121 [Caenorhabditis remanei]|uniref:Sdz-33 F-box domain-containing protein n=1 Tax=Caenorhabditis remanei TaxID=31234 RepID=E3NEE9_CAERE|nr:hypothetical protein CRE_06121 [Caenorhabditis remanei]
MDLNQLLITSLVSLKSKRLVTSLELRARNIEINISRAISLNVYFGRAHFLYISYNNSNDQNAALPADITLPVAASFQYKGTKIQSSTPLFSISNWLNHIRSVFCHTKPLDVRFHQDCERFEVQSLKNMIGNVDVLYVAEEVTDAYTKEVLKHFNARIELSLYRNPFDETCEIQKFFIQNYKRIAFWGVYSLDDMLLFNGKKVRFINPISPKQFNQFIKHWIRGSNPRLQTMFLMTHNSNFLSREVLLKGIHCVDVAKEVKLKIHQKHRLVSDSLVQIRRKDGTPAVIVTDNLVLLNVLYVRFIVLH